jgi:DNA polymerase I
MQKDNLILVDGSAYLYRAYHAMPALSSPLGAPTGAIYGVVNMLKSLLKQHAATADIIVVFDPKGPTARNKIYPEYKANRSAMPDELRVQIEPLHALIKALGFPLFIKDEEEADDVIGTFAKIGVSLGYKVIISSADKDFCQLVSEDVKLMNTMTNVNLDIAGVVAKFGVNPVQIIDYLALVGDSADNIPGITKVGPKTAAGWLSKYGAIEQVLEQNLTGIGFKNLQAQVGQIPLMRELVTINVDLAITPDTLRGLLKIVPDQARQQLLFTELGFKNWLKELGSSAQIEVEDKFDISCNTVVTIADYNKLKQLLLASNIVALNLILSDDAATAFGVAVAVDQAESYYIPVTHNDSVLPLELAIILGDLATTLANKIVVSHDIKAVYKIFMQHNIAIKGNWFDTMLLSYVLNSSIGRHNFDLVVTRYLNLAAPSYDSLVGIGKNRIPITQLELDKVVQYAATRVAINLKLYHVLAEKLRVDNSLNIYLELEQPLIKILAMMEATGVLLDTASLAEQGKCITAEIATLERDVHLIAGEEFNLASTKQLRAILFEKLQLPILKKTPTKQAATSEEVLSILSKDFEIATCLLRYRSLTKLKSTYIDKLPQDINPASGRVHCSYNQAVTATGRLSSNDPNLQNIPIRSAEGRLIRKAFIAPKGKLLLAADYSQVELRIMAHLSGDKALCDAFAEQIDIHSATAAEVLGVDMSEITAEHRRKAKAVNFGLIYGMSAFGLAKQLAIPRSEAQEYIDKYFARYQGVKNYMETVRAQALDAGYVTTIFGRKLYLQGIKDRNPMVRKAAERAAINAPLQGSASDIMKLAMIRVMVALSASNIDAKLLLQVHDELVFEVAENDVAELTTIVKDAMTSAATHGSYALSVPLEVVFGSGASWDDAH